MDHIVRVSPDFLHFLNSVYNYGPQCPKNVAKGRDSIPLINGIPLALNGLMYHRSAELLIGIYIHIHKLWLHEGITDLRTFNPDPLLKTFIMKCCNETPFLKELIPQDYERISFYYIRPIIKSSLHDEDCDLTTQQSLHEEYELLRRTMGSWDQLRFKEISGILSYESKMRLYEYGSPVL